MRKPTLSEWDGSWRNLLYVRGMVHEKIYFMFVGRVMRKPTLSAWDGSWRNLLYVRGMGHEKTYFMFVGRVMRKPSLNKRTGHEKTYSMYKRGCVMRKPALYMGQVMENILYAREDGS